MKKFTLCKQFRCPRNSNNQSFQLRTTAREETLIKSYGVRAVMVHAIDDATPKDPLHVAARTRSLSAWHGGKEGDP
jgi:hypothetical protein